MVEGYTRRSTTEQDVQTVAITAVDVVGRKAQGLTGWGTTIELDCSHAVGNQLVTPATGEQWYVQRIDMVWRLSSRIPVNDNNLLIEPVEGQVVFGGVGPVEINGSEANIRSPLNVAGTLGLSGGVYRDSGTTLERQNDAGDWVEIGGGVVESGPVPYDISFIQTTATRTVGLANNVMGLRVQRDVVLTSVTYRAGTADASGNLVVELRQNGSAISGTSATIAAASQVAGATQTGTWPLTSGDVLTVYTTAIGTTPGVGLVADIIGTA